jgi:glycosyltransferase involved in cell wall biosynthesis
MRSVIPEGRSRTAPGPAARQPRGPASYSYFIATSWGQEAVPRHFAALARELVTRGHQVVLVIDRVMRQLENDQVNPAVLTWPSYRPTNLRDAFFLVRLIQRYRPDCLVANFTAINLMMSVGKLMGVRHRVSWYHTIERANELDSRGPRWLARLKRWRRRFVYGAATHVVAVSEAAGVDARTTFGVPEHKIRTFLNAIADPLAGPSHLQHTVHHPARVVCVGRLHPSKGQDIVLKAVALVREAIPNIAVEFVGDGPSRESYMRLAHELGIDQHCTFVGAVPHDAVFTSLASATVSVVSSRQEAFGLATIESLAVGTPVVASNVGGIPEIIRDGIDGFLIPSEDPGALARRLIQVLLQPELRKAMSRNARSTFLERFEQTGAVTAQSGWLEAIVGNPLGGSLSHVP